jgi:hypothetical protein
MVVLSVKQLQSVDGSDCVCVGCCSTRKAQSGVATPTRQQLDAATCSSCYGKANRSSSMMIAEGTCC